MQQTLQHILTVEDCFTIEGRGLALLGQWHESSAGPDKVIARVGDAIELRFPSGAKLRSKIEAIGYPDKFILLPLEIMANDIVKGVQVWRV